MTKIIKILPIMKQKSIDFKKKKIEKWINTDCEKIEQQLADLVKLVDNMIKSADYIYIANKDVYYIPSIVGLFPNINKFSTSWYGCSNGTLSKDTLKNSYSLKVGNFDGYLPTEIEVNKCVQNELIRNGLYIRLNGNNKCGLAYERENEFWAYDIYCNRKDLFGNGDGHYVWVMPIYRLNGINSKPVSGAKTLLLWLKNDLAYVFGEEYTKAYYLLLDLYKKYKDYLIANDAGIIFSRNKLYEDLVDGKDFEFLTHKQAEVQALLQNDKIEAEPEYIAKLKKDLLDCDKRRANLDSYDENILFDPNRGHWDLWDWNEDKETTGEIVLDEGFTARDPADDINHGIVGIDFGTKSTVVVYENEHLQTLPLQVGSGSYSKGVQQKNYENPTVIQFIDIKSFMDAYNARAGRPFTSWNDVTVSHTAFDNLSTSTSDKYYSFFDSIKQWCGTDNMRIKLKDDKGLIKDLPPFLEIVEGDINPVEIIIDNDGVDQDEVSIGKTVTFQELPDGEEEEYTIVGSAEADPFSGKISNDSPIAQALIGKQLGDQVIIATPGGDMTVKITKVEAN